VQFFLNYVLWPFVGGAGFMYFGIMNPGGTMWWFLVLWFLPWLIWPLRRGRRRVLDARLEKCEKESDILGGLVLVIGLPVIMVFAGVVGSGLVPIYMEEVLGIDVRAKIEEVQKHVERDGY